MSWGDYDHTAHDSYGCECYRCEEKTGVLEDAKEFLQSIVDMLYSKETLNVAQFEDHLDELCHQLGVKMNSGDIQIQRLEKTKSISTVADALENWKQYTRTLTNFLPENYGE